MAKEAEAMDPIQAAERLADIEAGSAGSRPAEAPVGTAAETDSQEMEARGRLLTEYGELSRQLSRLMAEASSLGAEFQELSTQLRTCPNVVSVENLLDRNSNKPVFAQELFDAHKLVALISEIRDKIARKNTIQEGLQDIGILDAYGQFRY